MKREIFTEIVIEASADRVWQALIQLDRYPQWNSFIPAAVGEIARGAELKIVIHPPGESAQKYKVAIVDLLEEQRLEWLGHFKMPGLIDGHHVFELRRQSEKRTQLIQRELFSGLLVPFVWSSFLNVKLRAGFLQLNEELKKYIESSI